MLLSELIAKLEDLKSRFGDIPSFHYGDNEGEGPSEPRVDFVEGDETMGVVPKYRDPVPDHIMIRSDD